MPRRLLPLPMLALIAGRLLAAEPPSDPRTFECRDADNRPVAAQYVASPRYFAEARRLDARERQLAVQRGSSPYVIRINRDVYYLGLPTQRWLHQRQCIRIRDPRRYPIAEVGETPTSNEQEREIDCAAVAAVALQARTSQRMLVAAIESDMERLTPERWASVLPGPLRRLNLGTCPPA